MILRNNTIIVDTETTGLDPNIDEILQIAIVDGNGKILFNEYIKPEHHTTWSDAEKIHKISPETVKKCKPLKKYKRKISRIFKNATQIIGYNLPFDLKFLEKKIDIYTESQILIDLMPKFAKVFREPHPFIKGEYKWQKLTTAAAFYNYKYEPHDALNDVLATLHIANNLL